LLDQLYAETAIYYRYQRTQDIQATKDRSAANRSQTSPRDLAASIWDSLTPEERGQPVLTWMQARLPDVATVNIPDGKPSARGADDMFDPAAVSFRQGASAVQRSYANPEQAALVAQLAALEIRGDVAVPPSAKACRACSQELTARLASARSRFAELAAARTGQTAMQEKVVFTLVHWYTHGIT
jgi:hypothetical protein